MPTDDELARTAPAVGLSVTADASRAEPIELASLGRFRVRGVLGAGGMGVVHEAHDPELDRRVALKVLHAAPSDDARARLLREARAMAKLSHGNVITVYEVGTDGGRDYVAMELIDGGDLADWLERRPTTRDVLVAFIAAGRGLAAAHAAGIVHRDFKPKNVLRRRDGGVVVTDFGLAHEGNAADVTIASADVGLSKTMTGALLGTPAYMAPEQWRSEPVTPASDQFAFCAALWEALAGHRPFRGDTLEALREAILGGPSKLDDTEIPRPLRAILRRGLALDPTKRWPSMDALLVQLERVLHRRRRLLTAGASIVVIAAAVVAIVIARDTAPEACAAPSLDPSAIATSGKPALAAALAQWSDARRTACKAAVAERSQHLACLDGVLARIADAARGSNDDGDALAGELVEPELCARATPPQLISPIGGDLAAAFAAWRAEATEQPVGDVERLVASTEPCTRAIALLARFDALDDHSPGGFREMTTLAESLDAAAGRCSDDAIKTYALLAITQGVAATMPRAEAAADAFPSLYARALLDLRRAEAAQAGKRLDDGIGFAEAAITLLVRLQARRAAIDGANTYAAIRLDRATPDDLAAVAAMPEVWPSARAASPAGAVALAKKAATARWRIGDVAGGDNAMPAADAVDRSIYIHQTLTKQFPPLDITGDVVDEAGTPMAGAEVAASISLQSDSERVESPVIGLGAVDTTTDARGQFTLHGGRGFVAAKLGALRSQAVPAAASVHVVVHPTSRIEGTVALAKVPAGQLVVVARTQDARILLFAPVTAAGTFSIDGLTHGTVEVGAVMLSEFWSVVAAKWGESAMFKQLSIDSPVLSGIALAYGLHTLSVVARSASETAPEQAWIYLFAGKLDIDHKTIRYLKTQKLMFAGFARASPAGATAKPPIAADDLVTDFKSRPDGDITVCAMAVSQRMLAAAGTPEKIEDAMIDAELGCSTAGADATTVTVEVPPIRRSR